MARYNTYGNLAEKTVYEQPARHTIQKQRNAARVIKQQIPLNTKLRLRCLALVMLVAFMAMFVTFRNSAAVSSGYQLIKLNKNVAALESENDRLRLDIAKLKSPERIKKIAVNNLNMALPDKMYFANQN
ncbi:cell division protein FtsL [Pectinatus brassicae]|uniref:Cell division protein FtsL n=1 Tax=Pectinatus brassicae TaxID=862415 RepID=A0A840UFR4_9FIRM|nr:cell division protein FtsL [Pectinatus brassicae]MBB5335946.1 cell division protein FtsL [Pectinatus brassicae]